MVASLGRPGLAQDADALARPGVLGAVLIAALLRFWDLGARSVWFDEAYSLHIAQQGLVDLWRLLRTAEVHPPLHHLLLHFWTMVFGASEGAIRAPSALAGTLAVFVTFLFGRRLAGVGAGVLAAFFLAISPFHLLASRDARMYPLLTLFGLAATYALWLALDEGRRKHWVAYLLFTAGALYSHHLAGTIVLAHAVYVAVAARSRVRAWLLAMGGVGLLYAPLLPLLVAQRAVFAVAPRVYPVFKADALLDLLALLGFGGGHFGAGTYFFIASPPLEQRIPILLPFVLLLSFGVAALEDPRRRVLVACSFFIPLVVASGVSLVSNMFYPRYFVFLAPYFAIMAACGVVAVARAVTGTVRPVAVASLLAVITAFVALGLKDLYWGSYPYNWRAAARHVEEGAAPGDLIVYVPDFAKYPFEYYYKPTGPRLELRPRELLPKNASPSGGDKSGVKPENFEYLSRRHRRMWFVATIPLGYEARVRLGAMLAPYFKEREGRDFGRVYTFLWESRQGPPGDRTR